MIITCEKCNTKFNLDENLLEQTGSKVRCSKCQNIFLAYPLFKLEKSEPEEDELDFSGLELEETSGIEQESFDLYDIEKIFVKDQKTKSSLKQDSSDSHDPGLEETPVLKDGFEEKSKENKKVSGKEKTAVEVGTMPSKAEPSEAGADQLKASQKNKLGKPEYRAEKTPIINNDKKTKSVRKKSVSTPMLIILIITLLAGGLYGGYVILENLNIKIPFIGTLGAPDVYDAGNLHINIFDVSDKFINNSRSEKLFIVSGTVKNQYSQARSFIRIACKLYDKEKNLSKNASVYCGNMLSENDLLTMDISLINQKLANRMGDNNSNVNLKPGETLGFMMVFPYSSGDIEEYTVKVMSSSPA